jgi:hypothetical protein
MRSGRSFLILLVVAAALGGYIYFVEYGRDPSAPDRKAKVFAESTGLIEEVEVRAESGAITKLRRDGSSWQITEPAGVPADTTQVATLVSTIDGLEVERVVDENPASVSAYGLDSPRFTVAFRKEGETALRRLQVGGKTPTGGDVYARVEGDPKVILIAAYLETSLNKTTFDLREKAALAFERDKVDMLQLEAQGMPARTLAKQGDQWRLTAPVAARADFAAVDGLVQSFSQLQMKSVVNEDGTASLKAYGLEQPKASVTIGTGSSRATLAIGNRVEDGTAVYARDVSRPIVFTLETAVEDDAKKTAADLRLKDLFAFRSFSARTAAISLGGQSATFTKAAPPAPAAPEGASPAPASPPAEVWKRTAPDTADVDQAKTNDALTALSNLRAESFVDAPQSGGETLTVTVTFGGSTGDAGASPPQTETVTFRKSGSTVHAIVAGEPGAAVVSTAQFDSVLATLKELAGFK